MRRRDRSDSFLYRLVHPWRRSRAPELADHGTTYALDLSLEEDARKGFEGQYARFPVRRTNSGWLQRWRRPQRR
ncbi:MAG TPA: hypothetical protein VFP68_20295 [Burkholderiaceae bacterium]|nr:hypothetical protein [Burkholderiaceae bacterium]